jgi:hypothetical protein
MRILLSQAIEGYELAGYARRLSKRTLADYGNTFSKAAQDSGAVV